MLRGNNRGPERDSLLQNAIRGSADRFPKGVDREISQSGFAQGGGDSQKEQSRKSAGFLGYLPLSFPISQAVPFY